MRTMEHSQDRRVTCLQMAELGRSGGWWNRKSAPLRRPGWGGKITNGLGTAVRSSENLLSAGIPNSQTQLLPSC